MLGQSVVAGSSHVLPLVLSDVTVEMLVVFAIIAGALVLFVTQPIPIDTTAIAVMVALILLEPWTGVGPMAGVSGFSNPATITVLAMFILSEGVRQTGAIQILTQKVSALTGGDQTKQLLAIVTLSGPPAGFVNNTPIVAILIPAVTDLAKKANTSPSKLLLPMSFAAMMGGTLTLIGTSSNLLASDVWARQGGPEAAPFSMFEFTQLGIVVLVVGIVYLMTVGRYLTPARITPTDDLGEEFGVSEYLTDVVVREDASLIGTKLRDIRGDDELDLDVFQIVRNGRTITRGLRDERIRAGDILAVRADEATLQRVLEEERLDLLPEVIDEYVFHRPTGEAVSLSELFGDHDDLILIHNMGKECRYCTMWADGFNGLVPHIEDRAAFVVCSPDEPRTQQQFAESRGWSFTMVSTVGTAFAEDMEFKKGGAHTPGISTFHKASDGTIARIAHRTFGPQDEFCPPWHMFDILKNGIDGWTPQHSY